MVSDRRFECRSAILRISGRVHQSPRKHHMEYNQQRTGTDEELPTVCSTCGSVVDASEWHPTRSLYGEDGTRRLHVFCDEQCLNEWPRR